MIQVLWILAGLCTVELSRAQASPEVDVDVCSRLLISGLTVPEVHDAPVTWRDRRALTARRDAHRVRLPRTERLADRIQLFSIVVPVYRELDNGNLERLLEQIDRQTIDGRLIQVVLVVNNTAEVARRSDHPTLLENLRTVRWLDSVRPRHSFRLEIVDQTGGVERNMGFLRNLAIIRALREAAVPLRHHVIVNLDADCKIPADYLESLAGYYEHFDLDAVIARRSLYLPADGSKVLFQSHHYSQNIHLMFDLNNALAYPAAGYSTPQITLRADVAFRLGGFRTLPRDEDLDLGRRLEPFTVVTAPDVMVAQSDRERPDGFDAAVRTKIIRDHSADDEFQTPELPWSNVLMTGRALLTMQHRRLEAAVEARRVTAARALEIFAAHSVRLTPLALLRRDHPFAADLSRGSHAFIDDVMTLRRRGEIFLRSPIELMIDGEVDREFRRMSTPIMAYLNAALASYLAPAEQRRFNDQLEFRLRHLAEVTAERRADVRRLIAGQPLPADARADVDPFRANLRHPGSRVARDIAGVIAELRRPVRLARDLDALNAEQVLGRVLERYPEWLLEPTFDSWSRQCELQRNLSDWLYRAHVDPEFYPGTRNFLDAITDVQ